MPFGSRGGLAVDYVFPLDAIYKLDVTLGGSLGGDGFGGPAIQGEILELSIDGEQVREWEIVPAPRGAGTAGMGGRSRLFTIEVPVKAGAHRLLARSARPWSRKVTACHSLGSSCRVTRLRPALLRWW